MPNGHAHTAATIALTVATIPLVNPALTVGCASGLILSPDLDVDDGFIGLAHLRRVGRPLAWAWRLFWYPYSRIVPHRSPISHSIIFGTALRVGYLLVPFLILSLFVPFKIGGWFGWWFVGLCMSDALHVIMDKFSTALKGRKNG